MPNVLNFIMFYLLICSKLIFRHQQMLKLIIEVGPYFALLTKQHRVALLSRKYWPM